MSRLRRPLALAATVALAGALLAACYARPTDPNTQPSSILAAFQYNWCSENCPPNVPPGHFTPLAHPQNSSDETLLHNQALSMNNAGIQANIVSWFGPGTHDEQDRFPLTLQADNGTTLRTTAYYEPEGYGNPSHAQIASDLSVLAKYAQSPNWLRRDNKPVLFVYNADDTSCDVTARWKPFESDWYVVLKVFRGYRTCADQPASWHQYGPAVATDSQTPFSYSVSPGFWKYDEASPRLARDLNRWKTDLAQMKGTTATWKLITTWNEWREGTGVEPTTQDGTAYLDAVKAVFNPSGTPPPPPSSSTTTTTQPSTTTTKPPSTTSTTKPPTTTTTAPSPSGAVCASAPKVAIHHVVEIYMENHSYGQVIGTSSAPYETGLANQCVSFTHFATVGSPSYPNYIGATSGSNQGLSSDTTRTFTVDNIFRQVRTAGLTAREYHEGATACAQVGSGNAAKHEPRLSYVGGTDGSTMCTETPPLSQLDPNNLPNYAFVTPTLCDDMHDCSVATGDNWLKTHLGAILNGSNYRSGDTLVELIFDEPTPLANVFLNPGLGHVVSAQSISHYSELRLNEELFGVPLLANAASAPDIRTTLGL